MLFLKRELFFAVETPDEPEPPNIKTNEESPEKNLARLLEKVEGCSVSKKLQFLQADSRCNSRLLNKELAGFRAPDSPSWN